MSKNSKNILQEVFQRKQLSLPIYNSDRVGGIQHSPLWRSTVTLYNGQSFQGDICNNKSKADISAADAALVHLKSNNKQGINLFPVVTTNTINPVVPIITTDIPFENVVAPIVPINNFAKEFIPIDRIGNFASEEYNLDNNIEGTVLSHKSAILVDVENLPKFIDAISNKLHNYIVYAFIGEHHCLSEKEYPPGVIKITSPSTRSDGTDTCMQVYTGMLLSQEKYESYIIATRDHYGSTLVEMISSPGLGWSPKKARLVTNPTQL